MLPSSWPLSARAFASIGMATKQTTFRFPRVLIAGALSLCSAATGATSYVLIPPNPLVDASVIQLEVRIGQALSSSLNSEPLFLQHDRRRAFIENVRTSLRDLLPAAGIKLESPGVHWTRDRAKYESTGAPHHRLELVVSGRNAREETDGGIEYGFLVEARLVAEFLTPAYDSVETFKTRRIGFATEASPETKILSVITTIAREILDSGYVPAEQETLRLQDGQLSLDLTPPGHGDLLAFYRRELDNLPGQAALFAEPRGALPEPLATFSLVGSYPPAQVLVAGAGRYLVTVHRSKWHLVIYRGDGSIVRQLMIEDLLSPRDRASQTYSTSSREPPWVRAAHTIDHDRDRLAFSLPTGHHFGGAATDRIARIEIDLRDGTLVHPLRDYLVHREPPRVTMIDPGPEAGTTPLEPVRSIVCRQGRSADPTTFAKAAEVPLGDLVTVSRPMPHYTEIGRKARVTGRVGLQLLIAESGLVACVGVTEGLPMGLSEEARKATLHWRFSPLPAGTGFVRSAAAFDFDIVETQPEPY